MIKDWVKKHDLLNILGLITSTILLSYAVFRNIILIILFFISLVVTVFTAYKGITLDTIKYMKYYTVYKNLIISISSTAIIIIAFNAINLYNKTYNSYKVVSAVNDVVVFERIDSKYKKAIVASNYTIGESIDELPNGVLDYKTLNVGDFKTVLNMKILTYGDNYAYLQYEDTIYFTTDDKLLKQVKHSSGDNVRLP